MKKPCSIVLSFVLSLIISSTALAVPIVRNGVTEWGGSTRGGYGSTTPTIIMVNTLDYDAALTDSTRNGVSVKQGGIKSAFEAAYPRVILVEVSGTIDARVGGDPLININSPYVSYFGATGPSPGITLQECMMQIRTHDVYVSHLRIRIGDDVVNGPPPGTSSCIEILGDVSGASRLPHNIVIDHVSMSWAIDNIMGIAGLAYGAYDIIVTDCIFSEPLSCCLHPKGINHDKGLAIGVGATNILVKDSLSAHSGDRNPKVSDSTSILVVNNLGYNVNYQNRVWAEDPTIASFENNRLLPGPDYNTTGTAAGAMCWFYITDPATAALNSSEIYLSGNMTSDGGVQASSNDWSDVYVHPTVQPYNYSYKVTTRPFSLPAGLSIRDTADVKVYVLDNVGARPLDRDAVDTRIVTQASNEAGGGIIDSEDEVGGYPTLAQNSVPHNSLPADPHTVSGSGYTNLEDYAYTYYAALSPGQGSPGISSQITSPSLSTAKDVYVYEAFAQSGIAAWADRSYTWGTVHSSIQNFHGPRMYADDKAESAASTYFTGTLPEDSWVYIVWNDAQSPTTWLSTGYTDTGNNCTINATTELPFSIYKSNSKATAGTLTVNGAGSSGPLPYLLVVEPDQTPTGGETITGASAPASTYAAGQTIDITLTWSNTPDSYVTTGGLITAYCETGVGDLLFELQSDRVTLRSRAISAGMRTNDLNFKDIELNIPSGSSLTYSSVAIDPTLPASITNTTVVAAPITGVQIPTLYANIGAFKSAYGYLLPGDGFVLTQSIQDGSFNPTESGGSGTEITVDLNGNEWTLSDTVNFDMDYWIVSSSGACSNIVGTATISGNNNTFTNVNFLDGYTNTGSGNTFTTCGGSTQLAPGSYTVNGPATVHVTGGMSIEIDQ